MLSPYIKTLIIYLFIYFLHLRSKVTLMFPCLDKAENSLRHSGSSSSKNHQHKRCPSAYQHNSPMQTNRNISLVGVFCAVGFCQMTLQQHKNRKEKKTKDIFVWVCSFSDSEDLEYLWSLTVLATISVLGLLHSWHLIDLGNVSVELAGN